MNHRGQVKMHSGYHVCVLFAHSGFPEWHDAMCYAQTASHFTNESVPVCTEQHILLHLFHHWTTNPRLFSFVNMHSHSQFHVLYLFLCSLSETLRFSYWKSPGVFFSLPLFRWPLPSGFTQACAKKWGVSVCRTHPHGANSVCECVVCFCVCVSLGRIDCWLCLHKRLTDVLL